MFWLWIRDKNDIVKMAVSAILKNNLDIQDY